MDNFNCINNCNIEEIERYFGESEEFMENCSSCPNFRYSNGIIVCKKLNDKYNNEKGGK